MKHLDKAKAVVASVLGHEPARIGDDDSFTTLEGWDSINHLRIALELEKALGEELDPNELVRITSVREIAQCFVHHTGDDA